MENEIIYKSLFCRAIQCNKQHESELQMSEVFQRAFGAQTKS